MQTSIRPLRCFLLGLLTLLSGGLLNAGQLHLVLVGDSTVTDNAGWGLGFAQFLKPEVKLTNTARGGRSSMSFIKEGSWEKALALKADYYLIQFGHNDEPGKPGRSTTLEEYKAYMERYVDEARAIGAKPVLVTSLVRRQFKDPNNPHLIDSSLQVRAEVVRAIAKAKQVPLVELHDRSKLLCEKLGKEGCLVFSPRKEDGSYDGTHLNAEGYLPFARLVVEELRWAVPDLSAVLLQEPGTTKLAAKEASYDAVVAFDGSGKFSTVQAAIDAAPAKATKPFRILVKSGTYKEHVVVPAEKSGIWLLGEAGETAGTIITMDTNVKTLGANGRPLSTEESTTVVVRAANFRAENITFENTTTREQRVQALALWISGDRAIFRNCRFLGWQDTLRADAKGGVSRQYFRDCYITGHVDFIYGAGTSVFDHCTIEARADGYLTAANTDEKTPVGYVFLDCRVLAGKAVEKGFYLGRPWRAHASVTFLRCELPAQLRPEGWHNWGKVENEKTARYAEYRNTGPGADKAKRVSWGRELSEAEAAAFTVEKVLSGKDGWNLQH